MKKLKKISREELKQVKGAAGRGCKAGMVYRCYNTGVCEPDYGYTECCYCVPE